jgi:hypothetical protein
MIDYSLYKLLHVVAMLAFVGGLLSLLLVPAEPNARSRRTLAVWVAGCSAAVALVAGFGLHARLGGVWQGWLMVKIVAWFVILGLLIRFRARAPASSALAWLNSLAVVGVAVAMAIYKPF